MLKFNFFNMPIIFSMYKTGIFICWLNKKLTSRIQDYDKKGDEL